MATEYEVNLTQWSYKETKLVKSSSRNGTSLSPSQFKSS